MKWNNAYKWLLTYKLGHALCWWSAHHSAHLLVHAVEPVLGIEGGQATHTLRNQVIQLSTSHTEIGMDDIVLELKVIMYLFIKLSSGLITALSSEYKTWISNLIQQRRF